MRTRLYDLHTARVPLYSVFQLSLSCVYIYIGHSLADSRGQILPPAIKSKPKSDSESSDDGDHQSSHTKRPRYDKSTLQLNDGNVVRGAAVTQSMRRKRPSLHWMMKALLRK